MILLYVFYDSRESTTNCATWLIDILQEAENGLSSRGETEAEDKSATSSPTDIESPASGATAETVEAKEEPPKKEQPEQTEQPPKKSEEATAAAAATATRVDDKKEEQPIIAAAEKPIVEKVVEVSRAVDASQCSLKARTKPIATPSIIERKTSEELPSSCTLPSSPPPTPIDPSPLQQQHQQQKITTALAEALKSSSYQSTTPPPPSTDTTTTTTLEQSNTSPEIISNVPLTANVQIVDHHSIVVESVSEQAQAPASSPEPQSSASSDVVVVEEIVVVAPESNKTTPQDDDDEESIGKSPVVEEEIVEVNEKPPPLPRSPAPVAPEATVVVEPEVSAAEVHVDSCAAQKPPVEVTPSESARTKFFMDTLSAEEASTIAATNDTCCPVGVDLSKMSVDGEEADRSQNSMTFDLLQEKTFVIDKQSLPESEQAEQYCELQRQLDGLTVADNEVEDKLSVDTDEPKAEGLQDDVKLNGTNNDNVQELKQVINHTRNKNKNRNKKRKAKKSNKSGM